MNTVTWEGALDQIRKYLKDTVHTPFFVGVTDSDKYKSLLNEFSGLSVIRISDYCKNDSFPDVDRFISELKNVNVNCIVVGLGDIINLGYPDSFLGRLKDSFFSIKLIILCRGIDQSIKKMAEDDVKFNKSRYCIIKGQLDYDVVTVSSDLDYNDALELKDGFRMLEDGYSGKISITTNTIIKSGYTVSSAYDAIVLRNPDFQIPRESLDDEYWSEYYADNNLDDYDLMDWHTYLSYLIYGTNNLYIKEVVTKSKSYNDYKSKIMDALLDFDYRDQVFVNLYRARKSLVKNIPDYEIQTYIKKVLSKGKAAVYYLTDNTEIERVQIIKLISEYRFIPNFLSLIYKDLSDYLYSYNFHDTQNDALYKSYFDEYKKLKLFNYVSDEFSDIVEDLSEDGNRKYHEFDARNSLVEKYSCGNNFLLWVDGLGVEYLGYIVKKAKAIGLSMKVKLGQAILPSLTEFNKEFFDTWNGNKDKEDKFDRIIHDGINGFGVGPLEAPVHLIKLLDIIYDNLNNVKSILLSGEYDNVVLTSDHGASRLAVISKKENRYEMNEPGKHSGRCCKINEDDVKPVSATQDKGFHVLANYDRFKGGRASNVEVHGGATLEEVIVPVIIFSLPQNIGTVKLENLTGDIEKRMGQTPELDIACNVKCDVLIMQCNGNTYQGKEQGKDKYHFVLEGINKQNNYRAEFYADDSPIGELTITIKSPAASANSSNDFFDI